MKNSTKSIMTTALCLFCTTGLMATDTSEYAAGGALTANIAGKGAFSLAAVSGDIDNVTKPSPVLPTDQERAYIRKGIGWSNASWFMLAGNIAAIPLAILVDDNGLTGSIVGLATFTGWTLTQGFSSLAYGDVAISRMKTGSSMADYTFARFAHAGAASLGVGTIVGIGMAFSDETGTAVALAATCGILSWICGIAGNAGTYIHAEKMKSAPTTCIDKTQGRFGSVSVWRAPQHRSNGIRLSMPLMTVRF